MNILKWFYSGMTALLVIIAVTGVIASCGHISSPSPPTDEQWEAIKKGTPPPPPKCPTGTVEVCESSTGRLGNCKKDPYARVYCARIPPGGIGVIR